MKGADEVTNMNAFSLYLEAKLPPGFKLPPITKFTGTTPPKTHLQSYVRSMQVSGCQEPELAQTFHLTLTGAALRWIFDLERHRTKTWGDIVKEFMTKYGSNEVLEITRKHLEMAKQGENEGFSDFVTRWREMASQMSKRPDEKEQLEIIQKNFTPAVISCIGKHVFPHFRALLSMGSQVEEELAKRSDVESKKAPGQYVGKKTTTPVVNQLSSFLQLNQPPQNPYPQQNQFQ